MAVITSRQVQRLPCIIWIRRHAHGLDFEAKLSKVTVALDGTDVSKDTAYERVRKGFGYVPQGREIFGRLTVEENLRMGLASRPARTPIPAELFELFPILKQFMHRRGGDLSGGHFSKPALDHHLSRALRQDAAA